MTIKPRHIHKSMLESFDICPRYGYLHHYHSMDNGGHKGITKSGYDPSRAVGGAVHHGVNVLAMGSSVQAGVDAANESYLDDIKDVRSDTPQQIVDEHQMVIEAGVRIWAAVQLPIIQARYKIISTEQTIFVPLTDELTLIARPDIELMDNFDGRIVNYSLKTEKSHSYVKHPDAQIDIGGTVEMIALASKYGNLDRIAGTWMTYVVVGGDKEDESTGTTIRWHPGVRGWSAPSASGMGEPRYAWKYDYDNPNYEPYGPKGPKNPKTKRLSSKDGWIRFNGRDYPGGQEGWIADLLSYKFEPFGVEPIKELVISPDRYERGQGEAEEFLTEIITEQTQVSRNLEAVADGSKTLAEAFPRRRRSCMRFGRKCEMWDICWKGAGNNLEANGFIPRRSFMDKQKEKGLTSND